jgi:cytochrome P450
MDGNAPISRSTSSPCVCGLSSVTSSRSGESERISSRPRSIVLTKESATRDTELGDRWVREGDKVVMYYGSANRDDSVFEDPDRFDVGRTPNDHQAFGGGGPHYCLGSHLARVEALAMLREILTRLPDIEQAGPVERPQSSLVAGPKHLAVRFTPGRRRTR